MRFSRTLVALGVLLTAAGCNSAPSDPSADELNSLSLVPDYAESMASAVDAGGVGGDRFPANLALTTEQKAAIAALHQAFRAATAADVAALRALEAEARAAKNAGKSRDEIHAILARGRPIQERLHQAFEALQAAIWLVYTPEQRAWIEAHRPRPCGPNGPPKLSDAQIQQIRALQEAFMNQVKDDIATIRQVAEAAHQAFRSGASKAEVEAILHQADAARERVQAAERALHAALEAVLTPEQRAARCDPGPKRP